MNPGPDRQEGEGTRADNAPSRRPGRAHIIGMILCCIPMVIAIVWLLAASR